MHSESTEEIDWQRSTFNQAVEHNVLLKKKKPAKLHTQKNLRNTEAAKGEQFYSEGLLYSFVGFFLLFLQICYEFWNLVF